MLLTNNFVQMQKWLNAKQEKTLVIKYVFVKI